MGSLDCNEMENLKARGGRDYSLGHRIMYEAPIRLLTGKRWKIIEAGFGIGWGLEQMIAAGIIDQYVGFEPHPEPFCHVLGKIVGNDRVTLHQEPFRYIGGFDHVFCIEVIEHVPMDRHQDFLWALRQSGKTLWMSTPDVRKHPSEGVRDKESWKALLKSSGFTDVTVHPEQWTVLFVAQ